MLDKRRSYFLNCIVLSSLLTHDKLGSLIEREIYPLHDLVVLDVQMNFVLEKMMMDEDNILT